MIDGQATIVFATVCAASRRPWLANAEVHQKLVDAWRAADNWAVGRYVVMPDHVHFFASPRNSHATFASWVRFWKSLVTRRRHDGERWQSGVWDTRLRRGESYEHKWRYVVDNPVRHGLVERAEDWPFQGELEVLAWEEW